MTTFDETLPMILHRTLDAVMPRYRTLFARHELTEQQWRVLRVLWEVDRTSSVELARRTLLPAPSLVGIVDRLESRGLVARVRSTTDRRVVYVTATAEGRALGEEVVPHVDEINRHVRAGVPAEAWQAMQATLEAIAANAADDRANPSDQNSQPDQTAPTRSA
ncbi:MAG: MarR family transcriptional regulator [Actinomycetota bacterium]